MSSQRPSRWLAKPWLVLVGSALLTVGATALLHAFEADRARARFENEALRTDARIKRGLDAYVALLRGAASYFATSLHLDRAEFRRYVSQLDLHSQYPGILGLGFSRRIQPFEMDAIIAAEREDGMPDYHLWPAGDRPEYYPIVFLEPLNRQNHAAIGYDMSTDPTRWRAMEKARDTGLPAVTRKVTQPQEIDERKQAVFFIYVPVYLTAAPPGSVEERRALLVGYAYAPFRADDLFEGIFAGAPPDALTFQVYDGSPGVPLLASKLAGGAMEMTLPLELAGSVWTLRIVARPGLESESQGPVVLILGLLASLLLFFFTREKAEARARAESDALSLRNSEERYRDLFANSPLPTWVYDVRTLAFLAVNEAAVAHYGWSRAEFLQMTIAAIRAPQDVPALQGTVRTAPENAGPTRWTHRKKDGAEISVEISSHAILFEGRPARMVVANDVTGKERAEAARRKVEARFARLSESGILGMMVAHRSGEIVEANDAFLHIIGYSRADLEAGRIGRDQLTPPEWTQVNSIVDHQLEQRGFADPVENEYLRKDGSRVDVLVGMASLDPPAFLAFVLDISERKRLGRFERDQLAADNRRMLEANRLKSEFLANVTHELRTPLNAIIGFSELVRDGEMGSVSQGQVECLDKVLIASRHLLQLINSILDLAQVDSKKMNFHPQELELQQVIAQVVATLGADLAGKGLRVEIQIEPGLDPVTTDAVRLKQVLYNYLSNAIKFSHAGGKVTVRARPEGKSEFRIEVEDRGIGVQPDDLERLFVNFQQLHSGYQKAYQGMGLGLAVTKGIVEAQGGSVGVRSTYGVGSVFHAILPRAPATASAGTVHPEMR